MPYVKAAVMRLFEDDPQGYTKRLDTAFSVQNIVEELHYQHSDEAVRTVLNDMSGRAEPFVEQRDEGFSCPVRAPAGSRNTPKVCTLHGRTPYN